MTVLKRLSYILLFLLVVSPVFANECIDQIDDRKTEIALFLQKCQLQVNYWL